MFLDMPLRMPGQPSIFKMAKEFVIGARPLLKQVPYTWWPPKGFQNVAIGQFDLYPENRNSHILQRILSSQANVEEDGISATAHLAVEVETLEEGCFIVRNSLNLHFQQTIANTIREAGLSNPLKFKFVKAESSSTQIDTRDSSVVPEECKSAPKQNCYTLSVLFKDLPEMIKGLPLEIEGAVQDKTNHHKSAYKTVVFDFFKDGGFGEELEQVTQGADHKKKQRRILQNMWACIGHSCEIEYQVIDNGT